MLDSPDPKPERRYRGESLAERQAGRRTKLVEAGFRVFGSTGYRAATVRQVCAEAGLTERYFYESFARKDDLFVAVYVLVMVRIGEAMRSALESANASAEAKARALLEAYFGTIERDPGLGRILLIDVLTVGTEQDNIYRDAMAAFTDLVRNEARVLLPRHTTSLVQEEVIAAGIVGAIVHVAMRWVISNFERPREEVIAGLLDLLLAASR
jgi:AcrR family transcriptional regulator